MATTKQSSLDKVQSLYLMQVELWNFLDESKADSDAVKSVQKTLKDFKALLKEVDWQVMGGEDVYASLQMIPLEVSQKLKKTTPRTSAIKKGSVKKSVVKTASARKTKGK